MNKMMVDKIEPRRELMAIELALQLLRSKVSLIKEMIEAIFGALHPGQRWRLKTFFKPHSAGDDSRQIFSVIYVIDKDRLKG